MKKKLTASDFFNIWKEKDVFEDIIFSEEIDLFRKSFSKDKRFVNCAFPSLSLIGVNVNNAMIEFENCEFREFVAIGTFFSGGAKFEKCKFYSYVDFESGGQNEKPFILKNNIFYGFVNFFDCWFKDDVVVINNTFKKGTNLLGNKDHPYGPQYDKRLVIKGNIGALDIDGEGDKKINIIDLRKKKN